MYLKKGSVFKVVDGKKGNTIQVVGSGLEDFMKDMLAESFGMPSAKRRKLHSKTFSYAGNSNNPPDIILKNGDAIEVKKADSLTAGIQLNSSPPKAKLHSSDTRINNTCRKLALDEGWTEKDIFYAVGSLGSKKALRRLWLVYGDCFAASHDVYERAAQRITDSISENFEATELIETNELASIPSVDPLGITRLRVRGMWIVKNPAVVFEDIIPKTNEQATFRAYCLMLDEKYLSFPDKTRKKFEEQIDDKMVMHRVNIQSPDNPANLMEARLISYEI